MVRYIWHEGPTRHRVTTCVHSPDGILSQFRTGHQHLGTVGPFRKVYNTLKVQLLHSRDGIRW